MSDRQLTVSVKFPNNGKGWCFLLEDIVNDIRHLASDNKEVREKALWDLFELCWHQGTLYWQAAFVAPFLIERLPHESEPDILEIILCNLAPLACREALLVIRLRNSIGPVPLMGKFTKRSMFTLICWNMSRPKLELAIYMLAFCKRDAAMICAKLCRYFRNEPEEMVRATIPYCLAFISDNTSVDTMFFEELLNSDDAEIVKLAAGNTLAYVAGENMPEYALSILVRLWENTKLVDRLAKHSGDLFRKKECETFGCKWVSKTRDSSDRYH